MKTMVHTDKLPCNLSTDELQDELAFRVLSMKVLDNLAEMAKSIEIDTSESRAFDVVFDRVLEAIGVQ